MTQVRVMLVGLEEEDVARAFDELSETADESGIEVDVAEWEVTPTRLGTSSSTSRRMTRVRSG